MTTKPDHERVTFDATTNLIDALRRLAAEHDRSLAGECREAVRRYVDTAEGPYYPPKMS